MEQNYHELKGLVNSKESSLTLTFLKEEMMPIICKNCMGEVTGAEGDLSLYKCARCQQHSLVLVSKNSFSMFYIKFIRNFKSFLIKTSIYLTNFFIWGYGINFVLAIILKKENILQLLGVSFAILASFSSLSFNLASRLKDEDPFKENVVYAGERLLHACVFFLVASIIQFGYQSIDPKLMTGAWVLFVYFYQITLYIFLTLVLSDVRTGIQYLNIILWEKSGRLPDWEKFEKGLRKKTSA
jgi:hypothetical protein